MHNVRLEQINDKVRECNDSADAATIEFNLEGEWRTSDDENT